MSRPQSLAAKLGAQEAQFRLGRVEDAVVREGLFGALIDAELAATKPYWLGQRVALVGSGEAAGLYAAAMTAQGIIPEVSDDEAALLAGFEALRG